MAHTGFYVLLNMATSDPASIIISHNVDMSKVLLRWNSNEITKLMMAEYWLQDIDGLAQDLGNSSVFAIYLLVL